MGTKVQLDELDVLQSIFYNDEFQVIKKDANEDIQLFFWVHITLPEDYSVKYKESLDIEEYSHAKINYLPPIKLHLTLPESYPSKCSPKFTISCQWLTRLAMSKLCTQLDNIWHENENMEIIYMWVDFLKNDALNFLGHGTELDLTELYFCHLRFIQKCKERSLDDKYSLTEQGIVNKESDVQCEGVESSITEHDPEVERDGKIKQFVSHMKNPKYRCTKNFKGQKVDSERKQQQQQQHMYDRRACLNLDYKTSPLVVVLNYSAEREKIEFMKKYFLCNICFTDTIGSECMKFEKCSHVFCKNCIRSYFTVQINDGMVRSIKCPENNCSADASPLQVKWLVSSELFAKYDSLLLQSALDSLDHVIYCPRPSCQYPATKDAEDNVVICPNCQYVFCAFCKRVYHGVEPCKFNSEEKKKLVDKYLNATKEVKKQMELRYGAKLMESLVNNCMAESWIQSNCKNCPRCNVSIEKSHGCNKMACWKCSTYFCWLCFTELDHDNPYSHFSDPSSECANKLYEGTELDNDELDDYNSDDEQWRDWDWI